MGPLPIQALPTLDAKAVSPEVVMPTRRTHQPPRRISLQPPLVLAAVPDPVLRSQHPSPALTVENGEVTHRNPECARLQAARAPLLDQELEADLCLCERVNSQRGDYGRSASIA
jgi:hypothetical protein